MIFTWRPIKRRANFYLSTFVPVIIASAGLLLPASTEAKADLTISPAIQKITIDIGKPEVSSSLQVTNHSSAPQSLTIEAVDFGSLDETGGVYLIGQPNDFERHYGLAQWLTLGQQAVTLQPNETQTVPVTIENRDDLSPGGHYAAILFKQAANAAPATQANIGLKPVLTELLFVRKNGPTREDVYLEGTDLAATRSSLPRQIVLRLRNNGNVHEIPRGLVRVFDPLGKQVASGVINESSSIILPETSRIFPVKLALSKPAVIPGRYRVVIDYRFDGNDNFTRAEYGFNLVSAPLFAALGLGFILVLGILVALVLYLRHWRPLKRLKKLGSRF